MARSSQLTEKKHRPSAEIEAELESARKRVVELDEKCVQLKEELKACEEERKRLDGSMYYRGGGRIDILKGALAEAKRYEADQSAKPVVWKEQPRYGSREMVVSRVTKKRIYAREPGVKNETMFNRDGTPVSSLGYLYGTIDVEATLGADQCA